MLTKLNLVLLVLVVLLCSCSPRSVKAPMVDHTTGVSKAVPPPPSPSPPVAVAIPLKAGGPYAAYHEVIAGDTLHSIAWQYNKDYRQLAEWNHINTPNQIQIGDHLRVQPYPEEAATRRPPVLGKPSGSTSAPGPESNKINSASSLDVRDPMMGQAPVQWQWPIRGRILNVFDDGSHANRGIEIIGEPGLTVGAAADGKVVYSGSEPAGYAKLIIIKHSKRYLSAYTIDQAPLVNEGDQVQAGRAIAQMGSSESHRHILGFAIRRDGEPVDPMELLPKR